MYKALKNDVEVEYSLNNFQFESIKKIIKKNIEYFLKNKHGFYSLKMDELAITPTAKYYNKTNEIIGFCSNHTNYNNDISSLNFNYWYNIEEISEALHKEKKIHLAKEALFFTITKISIDDNVPRPIVILPICSHNSKEQMNILKYIIEQFEVLNPCSNLINIATDGDLNRRTCIKQNRIPIADRDSIFYKMVLFDCNLLFGKYGVNFDVKHLVKRIRGILISDKRNIILIKHPINKSHLELLLKVKPSLLNPSDYQNVPAAVELLQLLSTIEDNTFKENMVRYS